MSNEKIEQQGGSHVHEMSFPHTHKQNGNKIINNLKKWGPLPTCKCLENTDTYIHLCHSSNKNSFFLFFLFWLLDYFFVSIAFFPSTDGITLCLLKATTHNQNFTTWEATCVYTYIGINVYTYVHTHSHTPRDCVYWNRGIPRLTQL